jgi:hypothetical protein
VGITGFYNLLRFSELGFQGCWPLTTKVGKAGPEHQQWQEGGKYRLLAFKPGLKEGVYNRG